MIPGALRRRAAAPFLVTGLLAGPLFVAGSCVTFSPEDSARDSGRDSARGAQPRPASTRPWTKAFEVPAVLIANDVRIEGPDDLLEHVVVMHDAAGLQHDTKTVPQGLLQVTVVDPRRPQEINAHLDGLQIVALRRLEVLQRPGEVPVRVRATGKAFWSTSDGAQEKRGESLEFLGRRGP